MKEKKNMRAGKIILIVFIVLTILGAGAAVTVKVLLNNAKPEETPDVKAEGSFDVKVEELSEDHKAGVRYKFTPDGAIDSIGEPWHGLIRFGTENKIVINFYGGVSINEDTAKEGEDFYFHTITSDLAQWMGISASSKNNPLNDWTFINVPYCTGDWHIGTNDFEYTDKDGDPQILHHHGYTNFKLMMEMILPYIGNPEAVLVTGWSGGGFGASFLAEEIFKDCFPWAQNKTVLVAAAFLLKDDRKNIADNVWGTPEHIADRFTGDNLVLDSLRSLSENVSDAKILFLCSVRDEALTKYQNYLDTGSFEADKGAGKKFENDLKDMVEELLTLPNTSAFIWSDKDNDTDLTAHTVTMIQFVDERYNGVKVSDRLMDAVNGKLTNYGLDLVNGQY